MLKKLNPNTLKNQFFLKQIDEQRSDEKWSEHEKLSNYISEII